MLCMASFHSGTDDSGEEHSLCNTVFARQSLTTVFGPCVDKLSQHWHSTRYLRNTVHLLNAKHVPMAGVWCLLCPPPKHSPFVVADAVDAKVRVASIARAPPQYAHVAHSFICGEYFGKRVSFLKMYGLARVQSNRRSHRNSDKYL